MRRRRNPVAEIIQYKTVGGRFIVEHVDVDDGRDGYAPGTRLTLAPLALVGGAGREATGSFLFDVVTFEKRLGRWRATPAHHRVAQGRFDLDTNTFTTPTPLKGKAHRALKRLLRWLRHERRSHGTLDVARRCNPG
jgi:hypothetical protein